MFFNVFASTFFPPSVFGSLWFAELRLCEAGSKESNVQVRSFSKQVLCLGGILLVSLRGIMECDLKTFYSSSAPSVHPFSSPPCVSVWFCSLFPPPPPSSLLLPPSLHRRRGGLSTLWLVLLAVVQLWRMPAWLSMSCLIKMDQHITLGKAVLFSVSLKRQHSMRIGTSSGVREIHVGLFIS